MGRKSAVERATAYCRDAGKTPIRVKDVVGFAVNRVLHAFVIEAIKLVEEGVATPEDIDLACKLGLGHPIGPFELMDLTGIDVNPYLDSIYTKSVFLGHPSAAAMARLSSTPIP